MSRIIATLVAMACSFAANEVEAAAPHVKAAIDALGPSLRDADPIHAFVSVLAAAWNSLREDAAVVPSLTGLLGAVGKAAMAGFNV